MNSLQLKILAIIAMIIDHVGAFFFPNQIIFRIIGRISFPIFAYLLINTYDYTNNLEKKEEKLAATALITQIILTILNYKVSNIFISIWFSFKILENMEKLNKKNVIFYTIITMLSSILNGKINYIYETTFIIVYYVYRNCLTKKNKSKYNIMLSILIFVTYILTTNNLILAFIYSIATSTGMLIPEYFYNGKYGNKKIHKILWYIYPIHFIIIYFIDKCI